VETAPTGRNFSDVVDRTDLPRGFLNTAWPLAAAALMLLMLVRACVPASPSQVVDGRAIAGLANASALAALRALSPQPALADVIDVLNRSVVNFATGSDVVPVDAIELLRQAAAAIVALPAGTRLVVIGHTDNVGDAAANLSLSLRRANAVRAALVAYGAPADALAAEGRGDQQPVAGNDTAAGRFLNRRIEYAVAR
jgi:OOP family OmpA-OmpF porin